MAHSKVHVLNPDYFIRPTKALETWGASNTHGMKFVKSGTRAIVLQNAFHQISTDAARTLISMDSEDCVARYDGFSMRDVTSKDWSSVFEWHSLSNFDLEESTFIDGDPEHRCES